MFLIDIIAVRPLPCRQLELTFENRLRTIVEMDRVLKNYTGIFAPLLDENYFQQVNVDTELGTIVWPIGADVCPDVLYSMASGQPIIESLPLEMTGLLSVCDTAQGAFKQSIRPVSRSPNSANSFVSYAISMTAIRQRICIGQ